MLLKRQDNGVDHVLRDLLHEQVVFFVVVRLLQDLLPVHCGGCEERLLIQFALFWCLPASARSIFFSGCET